MSLQDFEIGGGLIIGNSPINKNPSAQVQFDSTEQGTLVQRMTEAQKLAIVNPAVGLWVYQTDGLGRGFNWFDGISWIALSIAKKEEHFILGATGETMAFTTSTNGAGAGVVGTQPSATVTQGSVNAYGRMGRISLQLPLTLLGRAQLFRGNAFSNLLFLPFTAWFIQAEMSNTAIYSTASDTAISWFGVAGGNGQWGAGNTQTANAIKIRPPFLDDGSNDYKFQIRLAGADVLTVPTGLIYVVGFVKVAIMFDGYSDRLMFFITNAVASYTYVVNNFMATYPTFPTTGQSGFNLQRPVDGGIAAHNINVDVYDEWIAPVPYHTNEFI